MGRILAIDYGIKRTGIAVTDPDRIIATGLTTVGTPTLLAFLQSYCQQECVDLFLVGQAKRLNNTPSESMRYIEPFVGKLAQAFPNTPIARIDERFTSKLAFRAMIDGGLKKKQRQNKALVDQLSATIMLQDYLQSEAFRQKASGSSSGEEQKEM